MQKLGGQILFSASDLTYFAECAHRTWLDRLNIDSPMEKAEDDEQSKLVQNKGFEHEAEYFAKLQSQHADCVTIDTSLPLDQRVAATRNAIESGAEVIYQGTLQRGNLLGHADFLLRTNARGLDGQWLYEVADTKLARSTKAKFILQLCFYSDLLSDLTGEMPHHMHVELGSGERETFRVADYIHYYRQLLQRYLEYVASYPDISVPYPSPCDHCPMCPWRDRCDAKRIEDDHLSAVAGITKQQIVRLEQAGINTVARLAETPADAEVPKLPAETLRKLREQAALQVEERSTGEQKAVLLPVQPGELRGFARLPRPDAGDLFFDMEGNPMQDGGLEYLFGLYYFDDGQPVFKPFWAHDREQEREAFSDFMDFVVARKARYPGMHIYHYADYERHALKKLMSLHGVKEAAVDQLFREHRLVDLYKVVREGLRISKPSYSIKYVEAFYAEKRSTEVKKATDSIVVYEHWCQTQDPALLESIRLYNEDDCRSTWQLLEWLLTLRPEGMTWFSDHEAETSGKKRAKTKSDKTEMFEQLLEQYRHRLITQPENPNLDPELAKLVESLLDFYRRAAKPVWWSLFARQEADFDELMDDPEVIAGLYSPEHIEGNYYRYSFPEQDFKLREGSSATRLDNLRDVVIVDIDEDAGKIGVSIRLGKDEDRVPETLSLSTGKPIPTVSMQNALFVFAESLLKDDGNYKSLCDYLLHRIPDINGIKPGVNIVDSSRDTLEETIAAVENLNDSYLFIQGPPGTGKTYTGSHLIARLLQSGKRVAVSSNSHKAINNLLNAVDKRMQEAGASYYGIKKISKEDDAVESAFIQNVEGNEDAIVASTSAQLVAGTAWLLSIGEFRGQFDYLFIDEAGQVSLANTIAMGMCARNLILLGDQMQLGQPIQGVHPGRSGESALEFLLNGEATIAPEKGIFLSTTYRMHPDVCRFISDAIYDSRLVSDKSTFSQALVLDQNANEALRPTGIRYIPVVHDGCSQKCEEEAMVVRELVDSLLTQNYRDGEGITHPFTLNDILVVAPYNMQVNLLKVRLPKGARVGTVDKFQGQEAQVVIISMATSSEEYLPRFIEFLFSKNRLNVAISRARCLSLLLFCDRLIATTCSTPSQIALVNLLASISNYSDNNNYREKQ